MVKNKYIIILLAFSLTVFEGCADITGSPEPVPEISLPVVNLKIGHDEYTSLINSYYNKKYADCVYAYDNGEYDAGIRVQGNLSMTFYKKSYKINFPEGVLSPFQSDKIILTSQMRDPTLMRYVLSLGLFKDAGLKTSRYEFVGVKINNEFKGIFVQLEPLDEWFLINRELPIGNLYEGSRNRAKFSFEGGYNVRSGFDKKTNENDNFSDLEDLIYIIDTVPDSLFPGKIEECLDVENALKYTAVSVLITNSDGFEHNFHFFNNPITGKFEFIPWDLDGTFGLVNDYDDMALNSAYGGRENRLIMRLLGIPAYKNRYIEILEDLMDSVFTESEIQLRTEKITLKIMEDYYDDPVISSRGNILDEEINDLLDYVRKRRQYIIEHLGVFR